MSAGGGRYGSGSVTVEVSIMIQVLDEQGGAV